MKAGLIFLVAFCVMLAGCLNYKSTGHPQGYLQGTVSIGPLCPVERNPPDPNCLPTQATFDAHPVWVWDSGHNNKIQRLMPDPNGNFNATLDEGAYVADLDAHAGVGSSNLPAAVAIKAGQATTLDVSIDTGIR